MVLKESMEETNYNKSYTKKAGIILYNNFLHYKGHFQKISFEDFLPNQSSFPGCGFSTSEQLIPTLLCLYSVAIVILARTVDDFLLFLNARKILIDLSVFVL